MPTLKLTRNMLHFTGSQYQLLDNFMSLENRNLFRKHYILTPDETAFQDSFAALPHGIRASLLVEEEDLLGEFCPWRRDFEFVFALFEWTQFPSCAMEKLFPDRKENLACWTPEMLTEIMQCALRNTTQTTTTIRLIHAAPVVMVDTWMARAEENPTNMWNIHWKAVKHLWQLNKSCSLNEILQLDWRKFGWPALKATDSLVESKIEDNDYELRSKVFNSLNLQARLNEIWLLSEEEQAITMVCTLAHFLPYDMEPNLRAQVQLSLMRVDLHVKLACFQYAHPLWLSGLPWDECPFDQLCILKRHGAVFLLDPVEWHIDVAEANMLYREAGQRIYESQKDLASLPSFALK
ncbi:unnamed protein product [Symbiodinium sp. KB8]|nr:unnamed protein product [Symbiodinium sp. KB8]